MITTVLIPLVPTVLQMLDVSSVITLAFAPATLSMEEIHIMKVVKNMVSIIVEHVIILSFHNTTIVFGLIKNIGLSQGSKRALRVLSD